MNRELTIGLSLDAVVVILAIWLLGIHGILVVAGAVASVLLAATPFFVLVAFATAFR